MPLVELSQELLQAGDSLALPREEGIALVVDSPVVVEEDSQAVQEGAIGLEEDIPVARVEGILVVLAVDSLRHSGLPIRVD